MKPAEFYYWRNYKEWTIRELAFLLRKKEPQTNLDPQNGEEESEVLDLLNKLEAIAARDPDLKYENALMAHPIATNDRIDSTFLLNWAQQIEGIEVPEELRQKIDSELKLSTELTSKERHTLLLIIAAMAAHQKLDLSKPHKAAASVESMLELIGAKRSINTIADKLVAANQLIAERIA